MPSSSSRISRARRRSLHFENHALRCSPKILGCGVLEHDLEKGMLERLARCARRDGNGKSAQETSRVPGARAPMREPGAPRDARDDIGVRGLLQHDDVRRACAMTDASWGFSSRFRRTGCCSSGTAVVHASSRRMTSAGSVVARSFSFAVDQREVRLVQQHVARVLHEARRGLDVHGPAGDPA